MTNRQIKAKEHMELYREAARRVRQCAQQYERECLLVDSIRSSSDNDGMPHGSSISKQTEARAIRLADKRMDLINAKIEAFRIQREIFELAVSVGGVESDVLIHRYIDLEEWEDVCDEVSYSWRQVHRYHLSALDLVAEKLKINE